MLTKIIEKELVDQAEKLIQNANIITILTHMGPDGDAMGSSLALYHFLLTIGKEQVRIIVPNKYADTFAWMPGVDQIIVAELNKTQTKEQITSSDLIIGLDFNHLSRIERLGDWVAKSTAKKLLIDHHLHPQDFADTIISYPSISSTCELVFRLICRMGYFQEMTQTIAECIYTGMMTDTGNFSYNSNSPDIYTIISQLLTKGLNKDEIYDCVNNNHSSDRLQFLGYCLNKKLKFIPEYNTAIITVTQKEMEKFNYRVGDLEGLVNYPLGVKNVIFSIFLREEKDKIKISFRSQGSFPANKVASDLFHGGGHLNAAGAESYQTMLKTVSKIKRALPKYF